MAIYDPPHPGEFIRELYIEPSNLSIRKAAAALGVSPSTLNRLLNGQSAISSEMALRLSITLGRSAESWLAMQDQYDLWQVRQKVNLDSVRKIDVSAA